MADIDVERKGRAIWPWLLGLLVAALLIWALLEAFDRDADEVVLDDTSAVPAEVGPGGPVVAAGLSPAVEEYSAECTSTPEARQAMAPEHEYTAQCIRLLSTALSSVIQRDTVGRMALEPALAAYREQADALEESPPDSPGHANLVRSVAIAAADLMGRVQEMRADAAPGLGQEVEQARTAAEAIRMDVPLLEQRTATGEFFQQAGEALRLLGEQGA